MERYGLDAATEAAAFENANVKAVSQYVEEEKVDCDFVLTRAMDVFFPQDMARKAQYGYDKLVEAGVKITNETYAVPDKYAEKVSSPKGL